MVFNLEFSKDFPPNFALFVLLSLLWGSFEVQMCLKADGSLRMLFTAGVPNLRVVDQYRSITNNTGCSAAQTRLRSGLDHIQVNASKYSGCSSCSDRVAGSHLPPTKDATFLFWSDAGVRCNKPAQHTAYGTDIREIIKIKHLVFPAIVSNWS